MKRALRALYEGESAVLVSRGVLCAGEMLPFDGKTFLRLAGAGLVSINGNRIAPTLEGRSLACAQRAIQPGELNPLELDA